MQRRASSWVRWAWASAALCALAGCSDPLKRRDQLVDTRVLGARVTVDGAPERAWPARGESAHVDWLVVGPEPNPAVGWAFAVCAAGPSGTAVPACDGKPVAVASSPDDTAAPSFGFTVPADFAADRLALLGVVCPDSDPTTDAQGVGTDCANGSVPTRVSLTIPVASASRSNHNPVLGADAIALDGVTLPEADARTGCSASLPYDRAEHRFHVTLRNADREPLVQVLPQDPPRETLQVSYFTTGGSFEFPFSSVEPDAVQAAADVGFTLPEIQTARTLWLYFVLRDLRGGADWAARILCVAP